MILVEKQGIRIQVPENEVVLYIRKGFVKVEKPAKVEATPEVENDYEDMSYDALGSLIEERGLEFQRSKNDRIQSLQEFDQKSK